MADMQSEKLTFWLLYAMCLSVSFIPVYPPIPLVWLCASMIWYHRYGPSWYVHDQNTDEDHIYIFDLIVCLPLATVMMTSVFIESIQTKRK